MKKLFFAFIGVILLVGCDNKTEVSGIVEFETRDGFRPDYNATIYATQSDVQEIVDFIDATKKYDQLWLNKQRMDNDYGDFLEKQIGISKETYMDIYSRAFSRILKLKGGSDDGKAIKVNADNSGKYSLKLKGDNWNLVYFSNNLNSGTSDNYIRVKKLLII